MSLPADPRFTILLPDKFKILRQYHHKDEFNRSTLSYFEYFTEWGKVKTRKGRRFCKDKAVMAVRLLDNVKRMEFTEVLCCVADQDEKEDLFRLCF